MRAVKSRRELYSEATRAALIETATRLFAERGFTRTALEDIAAESQVTRGAVYHHFANKQALFEAVLDEVETVAMARSIAAAAAAPGPWEGAQASLAAFLDNCMDPVYSRLVWQEGPTALGFERWKVCEEQHALGHIQQLLAEMVEAAILVPMPIGMTARFAFALLGAAGQAIAEAAPADRARVRDECAAIMALMLQGLRAPA